ncbi:MAG: FAM160 family protein [Treponema sp.]|jgi:hypothetical protein|nr:FAM160 family protein [Treponema sp.]
MLEIFKSLVGHAAFPAVFASLLTLVIANLFDLLKRKSLEKQTFFEHFFQERIKAYNELLVVLPGLMTDLAAVSEQLPEERPKALTMILNKMNKDFFKQTLWFEHKVVDMLNNTKKIIYSAIFPQDMRSPVEAINNDELNIIMLSFTKMIVLVSKTIEVSSGTSLLDRKFKQLTSPSLLQRTVSFLKRDKKKIEERLQKVFSMDWNFIYSEYKK